MAFHSPIMECIHDELEEFIAGIEFHPPTNPGDFKHHDAGVPADSTEIKSIVMAHLESPVIGCRTFELFGTIMEVRLFVEVGPRAILSNLVSDCIEEAECVSDLPAFGRAVGVQNSSSSTIRDRQPSRSWPCPFRFIHEVTRKGNLPYRFLRKPRPEPWPPTMRRDLWTASSSERSTLS